MIKRFFLVLTLSLSSSFLFAQSIAADNGVMYLYPNENREASSFRRGAFVGPHILGDTITMKLNEFEKRYIYYKPGAGAYAVEEKVTLKNPIYKAVKKCEDYFSKSLSKGEIPRAEAFARLDAILDVGIKLMNFKTEKVEKDLKKIKNPIEIEKYLINIRFRN